MKNKTTRIVISAAEIISPWGFGLTAFNNKVNTFLVNKISMKQNQNLFKKKVNTSLSKEYSNLEELDELSKYLLLAVAKLKQKIRELPTDIIIGTAFASSNSIFEFEKNARIIGYQGIKPVQFPNTVGSTAANRLAIINKLPGTCETISGGLCSGLDSIGLGILHLKIRERAKSVLCGGAEEFYPEMKYFFTNSKTTNSFLNFTAGAGLLILESVQTALKNKHNILGEIVGYRTRTHNDLEYNIENNISSLLTENNIQSEEVTAVFSNKNGVSTIDLAEASALKNIFGKNNIKNIALKKYTGEGMALSGIMQTIAGVNFLKNIFSAKQYILINNINPEGRIASLIIRRYEQYG